MAHKSQRLYWVGMIITMCCSQRKKYMHPLLDSLRSTRLSCASAFCNNQQLTSVQSGDTGTCSDYAVLACSVWILCLKHHLKRNSLPTFWWCEFASPSRECHPNSGVKPHCNYYSPQSLASAGFPRHFLLRQDGSSASLRASGKE